MGGWEYDSQINVTLHHNFFYRAVQRTPLCVNTNLHNYNNYYLSCTQCISPRASTYIFSEANYFDCITAYYHSENYLHGVVKSYKDIYSNTNASQYMTYTTDREKYVENNCKPDYVTDYSRFDTDPELFYYDAENKCSDVDILLPAEEVPEFVEKYAGAGIYLRLDIPQ